jgi:hypothetical protein
MKKILAVALIAVVALLLTSAGVSAAPSNGPKIIKCDQFIAVYLSDLEPHWRGNLSNCFLGGADVHYYGKPEGWFSGKVAHFYEDFVIYPKTGGYIKGYDDGLWNFGTTWKFRAEGRVTEASSEWSYLVGYKFHEMGTTDDANLPGWTVLKGPSTMFLAGP